MSLATRIAEGLDRLVTAINTIHDAFLSSTHIQQDDINTSTSYTINPTNGNIQKATATANFTLVFSGFTTGKYQEFKVYAANWGAYTFTSPTGLRFNGSTLPAFTVSGTDIVVIEKDKNEVFTLKLIAKNIGAI